MAKSLLSINNKYLVLQLSYSDTKPKLWYYKGKDGNKVYQLLSIGIAMNQNNHDWAISIGMFPFALIFGFPILLIKKEKEK